ncbi:DNA-binding domain-containing protein [uncultured Amphritea sp.]|uniref:HvfC/BufC N-terminal domain-containing protein n=1 Tax=uncultured Amphritea sp. TaxID=981605 RepID=UPI0026346AE0|nr:DNA-binding domain-containing protein [uncultured Amphritea sp.]
MSKSSGMLHLRQQQMMAALLAGDDAITAHIAGDHNLDAQQRLSIYQSGYRLRLREVIDNDHPVLGSYLGDDLFEQMVDGYIESVPSRYRSLRYYCDPLPDYLKRDSFFGQYPHIAELARFERGLLSSFDAPDWDTASVETLQQLPPELWPGMQLRFHPSLQLFSSHDNAVEIWQAIKADQTPPNPSQQSACWVIWRNRERLTEFRSAAPLEQRLIHCFIEGENFTTAAELTAAEVGEEAAAAELLSVLVRWLELGWISQLTGLGTQPTLEIAEKP